MMGTASRAHHGVKVGMTHKMSPEGTVDLSPGRQSWVSFWTDEKSRRDD